MIGAHEQPFLAAGEMGRRVAELDWAETPIGAIEDWPASLRTAVGICLSSRHPMVIWWGPELVLIYNDAWVPILGPSKHPALGRPGSAVWPEMWHIIGKQMSSVLATGEATWSDDQLLPANRYGYLEEAYFTYSYSPIRDESNAVCGVFTAVTETTSRVLGERRLRTLRALGDISAVQAPTVEQACTAALATLAANRADVPFGLVYLMDPGGASARLVASHGVELGTAIVPPTLPAATGDSLWRAATTGRATLSTGLSSRYPGTFSAGASDVGAVEPDTALVLPLAASGSDRPIGVLSLGVSPYRALDEDYRAFLELVAGHVTGAVTDARAYETERHRAEELAELDRAKTAFFSNISHEFRTPLTLIMGPLEELRAEADPQVRSELDVIHRNGLRLRKLVNTLLDFSRIQAGRVTAAYEPVNICAITAELASVFRSAIERAGLEFAVDCDVEIDVYIDREMWEKVVLNLLSNALKFTFEGCIDVSLRQEGAAAVLRVRDTGTGVPAEELPRLFERFHRVERARARSTEGSGIGLALVAELVALHGGTITADSVPDVGTTFTVTIPLGRDHLPADQVLAASAGPGASEVVEPFVAEALRWVPGDDSRVPAGLTPAPGAAERLKGDRQAPGRVLVADDNADMREYVTRLLSDRYTVHAVADGLAALEHARAERPDLVISDVMMPELDGLGLVTALRGDPRTAGVPVLLLSARAGQEAAVEGLAAGADDYLVKPFSARELLARVDAHLELGRVRRAAEERFRAMADLAPAMIWVSDRGGRRVFLNRGWQDFTGTEPQAELGFGWRAGVHREDLERYLTVAGEAQAARRPYELDYRLRCADGTHHWVLERAAPIGEGEDAGYVGSCVDINARYRENERQTLLARISAALDAEIGVQARLARLTRLLVEARLADQVTVRRVAPTGELVRLAAAAVDAESEDLLAALPPDTPLARRVQQTNRPLLMSDAAGDRAVADVTDPEHIGLRGRLQQRSAILVPLQARGRVLGVLALGRKSDAPRYGTDDLAVVEDIAERAGIALDNALLLAEERATARRLELLHQTTAELSAAATPLDVARTAIGGFTRLLGASAVAVYELRETWTLEMLSQQGWGQEVERDWLTMPMDIAAPGTDAVRYRRPVWLETRQEWNRDYPVLADVVADLGVAAAVALPLPVGDRCIGSISVGFVQERRFSGAERTAALSLAEQCAQALQRAQLLQAESEDRRAAERFSGMVSALSGATGLTDVAQVVLSQSAALGADASVVVLRIEDQLTVLGARGYPAVASRMALGAAHPLAHAVRTGEPVWLGSRSSAAWRERGFEAEADHLRVQVAIPLVVDNTAIGAIGLRFAERLPPLTPDRRSMLLTLGAQCAQALDRARLYQAEHEVAQALQRSLLPHHLPALARLALAERYLPGTEGTEAGGDWYEVLPLDDGRVAMVVGDVVGRGPGAAAVMGQLRSSLASYLLEGHPPAVALEHFDRFARRLDGATGSTAAVLVIDCSTGELCWARAGHPPPLVVDEQGHRFLDDARGTLLGVSVRPPFTEGSARIEPGASVLLYTDGLFERRGEVIDDGLARLATAAYELHELPPDALATQLLHRALDGAGPADDVALIVARLIPAPLRHRLPAVPAQLPVIRRAVRSWVAAAGVPAEVAADLQITLGEATANAVEHSYPPGSPGEFEFELERDAAGALQVRVRDFGAWRPEPANNGHRGRGLQLIRELGSGVALDGRPDGTEIRFHLPPRPEPQDSPRREVTPVPCAGPAPATLLVDVGDGVVCIEVRGDLDLAGVTAVRGELLDHLSRVDPATPVTIDLRPTGYLSSAGVGLLTEALGRSRAAGTTVRVVAEPTGLAGRVLDSTGLAAALSLTEAARRAR